MGDLACVPGSWLWSRHWRIKQKIQALPTICLSLCCSIFLPVKLNKERGHVYFPVVHTPATAAAGCPFMACASCCLLSEVSRDTPRQVILAISLKTTTGLNCIITQRPGLAITAVIRAQSPEAMAWGSREMCWTCGGKGPHHVCTELVRRVQPPQMPQDMSRQWDWPLLCRSNSQNGGNTSWK